MYIHKIAWSTFSINAQKLPLMSFILLSSIKHSQVTGSGFIFLGMCHTIDFATNSANLLFMHKHLLACMNHEYLPHDDLLGFQSCMRGIVSNNTSTYWYNQLWLSCMLHKKACSWFLIHYCIHVWYCAMSCLSDCTCQYFWFILYSLEHQNELDAVFCVHTSPKFFGQNEPTLAVIIWSCCSYS